MSPSQAQDAKYLLLESVLHANQKPHMLGRVVSNTHKPLKDYVPDPQQPEEILPEISSSLNEKVDYSDLLRVYAAASSNSAKVDLTELLHAHASNSISKDVTINAATVTEYQMHNPGRKFNQLMAHPEYKKQVKGMVTKLQKKLAKPAMVTGFLTCKDLAVSIGEGKKIDIGGKTQLPASSAAGGPPALDPKLEMNHESSKSNEMTHNIAAEVIFAVSYDYVVVENYNKAHWQILKIFKRSKSKEGAEDQEPTYELGAEVSGHGIKMFGDKDGKDATQTPSDPERNVEGQEQDLNKPNYIIFPGRY
jgi:hypothetical protein